MMPGMDGYEVVREIRHANIDTPVLMLTARGSVSDKIAGLDHGADDYMTKPFSPAELMAHLRALMRRQGSVIFETVDAGDVSLKLDSHELVRNGKTIHLSKTEFALAKMLMSNKERILPKEMNLGHRIQRRRQQRGGLCLVFEKEASLPGIKCADRNDP